MTIKQYAIEQLFPVHSDGDRAWQELKALLDRRIVEGLAGGVATKSIDMIAEEELDRLR